MKSGKNDLGMIRPAGARRSTYGRWLRHVGAHFIGLGLAGVFATNATAQVPLQWADFRLTVNRREMAMGKRTEAAGQYWADSLQKFRVYVPKQCVGTRRCPLLIYVPALTPLVPGAGWEWTRPAADKYGMLVLVPDREVAWAGATSQFDAGLKQVFRKFAVDPDKVAIVGHCALAEVAMLYGAANSEVFSRVVGIAGAPYYPLWPDRPRMEDLPRSKTKRNAVRFNASLFDDPIDPKAIRQLRQAGYQVAYSTALKPGHSDHPDDLTFVGRWLYESWAPTRPKRPVVALDSLPLLTVPVLSQLTTFWARFQQEPDSIRTDARRAQLREVSVPVTESSPLVLMTDMTALDAQYPSVATALTAAGLTARQYEGYRAALISAQLAKGAKGQVTFAATSALAKNVAFVNTYPDEVQALEETGILYTP